MIHPRTDHTKRLCVVAPNWLGDAVMSRSLIGLLGASGVRLSVMAPMYTARVYVGMRELDELIVDGDGGRMRRIRERTRTFRALRPDAVVLLPPSFSSAVTPWLANVRVRVGSGDDLRAVLLNARLVPRAHRGEHLAETYVRLGRSALGEMGLRVPERWVAADLHVSERDRLEAQSACGEFLRPGERYVVVVPGATFGAAKSWPETRFRELCSKLARSIPVLVAGTSPEEPMCQRVSDGLPGVRNVAGTTSLGGFIGLLGGASSVVANDSGSPHLSAALNTPTVVLFGSTSPTWTAPMGKCVHVIQHVVHCNPCFRRTCPTELECFNGIEVDEVLEKTLGLAGEHQSEGSAVDETA